MSVLKEVKKVEYYDKVCNEIAALNYNKPPEDDDDRQRMCWNNAMISGYDLKVVKAWDFKDLAGPNDPHYETMQTRTKGEEGVKDHYDDFYVNGVRQERIIWGIRIAGKVYTPIGHKRTAAHVMGVKKGNDSKCDVLMVDPGPLSEEELVKIGYDLALIGNEPRTTTRPLDEGDYRHQLIKGFEVEKALKPEMKDWGEDLVIEWAKEHLGKLDKRYKLPKMATRAGRICSQAFSSAVGQVIPMPDSTEIAKNFRIFWPNNTWNEESTDPHMIAMSTHKQSLKSQILHPWSLRPAFTTARKEAWLTLRCGTTKDAKITKQDTIDTDRENTLAELAAYNVNLNHVGAGYPLVTRVMFVKQMNIDSYVAYEWNVQTKQFNKISEEK